MKDIKNIKSNDILNLICKIYKRRKETSLLDTIPFLVSLANFCFVRGYLTESQKQSVFTIYSLYVTEKKYQKKKKTSDL